MVITSGGEIILVRAVCQCLGLTFAGENSRKLPKKRKICEPATQYVVNIRLEVRGDILPVVCSLPIINLIPDKKLNQHQYAHMPTCPHANIPSNQGRVSWALSGSSYLWINSLCCITITTRKLFSMLQYHYVHAKVFDCLAGGCTGVWCQCPPTEQLHSSLPGCSWRGSHNQGTVQGSSILWLLPGEINQ